ncbi:MAG: permease-like cell division protein FtsX [Gammaproteobacteria bacterium]
MIGSKHTPSPTLAYFRGHKRAVREGFSFPWKKPIRSILTIATLAICFFIPLFLWMVWLNYDELKQSWQTQGSIAVFVKGQTDESQINQLIDDIKANPVVESAHLINTDEVKLQLESDKQLSKFTKLIKSYDLPQQIGVKTKISQEKSDVENLVKMLEQQPQVEYVSYDQQWLNQLQGLTSTLLRMSHVSALLFLVIIIVILGNTIGNEIAEHKQEIRLLELIGASNAQVRRSFLYMGVFLGIFAGILAVVFLFVSFWWLDDLMSSLMNNFGVNVSLKGLNLIQVFAVIGVSILVTWFAARVALTGQRLNEIID